MIRRKQRNPSNTEITDWERPASKRTPPRPSAFSYRLNGQRYLLRAPEAVVLAAMNAYARVAPTEVPA